MKYLVSLNRTVMLVLIFGFCFNIQAQEDSTRLKFTEEIAEEPENKNVKWVRLRPHQYNMENVSSMFKIGMSPLYLIASRDVFVDFAYEKKIPRSQWSLELKLRTNLRFTDSDYYHIVYNFSNQDSWSTSQTKNYVSVDLVARYYLLKNRRMAMEKSGDNLWGFYATARLINPIAWTDELETIYDRDAGFGMPHKIIERSGLSTKMSYVGLGIGYQQRFLKRAFFDVSGGYTKRLTFKRYNSPNIFLDLTVGFSIFKVKK